MLTKTAELTAVKLGRMCLELLENAHSSTRTVAYDRYRQETTLIHLQEDGLATPSLKARERLDNFYHWLVGQK